MCSFGGRRLGVSGVRIVRGSRGQKKGKGRGRGRGRKGTGKGMMEGVGKLQVGEGHEYEDAS